MLLFRKISIILQANQLFGPAGLQNEGKGTETDDTRNLSYKMRKILTAAVLSAVTAAAFAQSGTNSPYSQYGLGLLSDQTSGFNRGMNGLGLGFHEHNQVNFINPASYASIDSLTFIFDAGISGQVTNFSEQGVKKNANNAEFEYVVAGFRAARHLGVAFGLLPFTNIGYNYSNTAKISQGQTSDATSYVNTYTGEGGLHQVFVGAGWQPVKGLSVGVNIGYLWGSYTRSVVNSYTDAYINTLSKYYTASVNNYKFDAGIQYTARVSKHDELTLGLSYTLGHKLHGNPKCEVISTNSQTAVSDTASYTVHNALELPHMYGAGIMWNHNNRWKVGVDYSLQKWASTEAPVYQVVNERPQYVALKNQYNDRHKVTVGGELCPMENSRNFFKRIHYRMGASLASSYLKINGLDGPKEYSVSAGFGIPVVNTYNNRSLLNISAQWVCQDSKTFIKENSFRINIGLTFNERWFAKWKVE